MSKFARMDGPVAVEVFTQPEGFTLDDCFHEGVASLFSPCPGNVTVGSTVDGAGNWTFAPDPNPAEVDMTMSEAPKVSPVQFKLLFTSPERVAIKAARTTDPMIDDFFDIVDDPRLTGVDLGLQSTKDAIAYLVVKNLLTQARASNVLAGVLI